MVTSSTAPVRAQEYLAAANLAGGVPAETSFETFLRYTDEKERSAELMGGILDEVAATTDPIRLLDIGTGNGEFVTRSLDSMESRDARVEATLVEPSEDLFSRLHDLRNPSFTQPPRLINEVGVP